jgi:hypothetical protein
MSEKKDLSNRQKKREFNKQRELEKEIKNGKNYRGTVRNIVPPEEEDKKAQ